MKAVYILLVLTFTLSSCKTDQLTLSESQLKADNFITGNMSGDSFKYTGGGETPAEYYPQYITEANAITFEYRNHSWQEGAKAMDDFMNKILTDEANSPDLASRIDLQIITFMNFDQFIFKAEAGTEKSQIAAQNLERLMQFTKPIEWKILTKALVVASPALAIDRYQDFRNYILDGAALTLSNPDKIIFDQRDLESLQKDARFAVDILQNK